MFLDSIKHVINHIQYGAILKSYNTGNINNEVILRKKRAVLCQGIKFKLT